MSGWCPVRVHTWGGCFVRCSGLRFEQWFGPNPLQTDPLVQSTCARKFHNKQWRPEKVGQRKQCRLAKPRRDVFSFLKNIWHFVEMLGLASLYHKSVSWWKMEQIQKFCLVIDTGFTVTCTFWFESCLENGKRNGLCWTGRRGTKRKAETEMVEEGLRVVIEHWWEFIHSLQTKQPSSSD